MKFKLLETFRLTEDEASSKTTAIDTINKLLSESSNMLDCINVYNKFADNTEQLKKLTGDIDFDTDFTAARGKVGEYITAIEKLLTDTATAPFNALTNLKTAFENTNGKSADDPEAKSLETKFGVFKKFLTDIFDVSTITDIKKVTDLLTSIKDILTKLLNTAKTTEISSEALNKLTKLVLPEKLSDTDIVNKLTEINNILLELNNIDNDSVEKTENSSWQKQYKEASDTKVHTSDAELRKSLSTFWDKYYASWESNADKVRNLGTAFQQELTTLGFTEETNPFIPFVKYALTNGFDINVANYAAIHNAFNRNLVNSKILRTPEYNKLSPKIPTIIYNKYVYDKFSSGGVNLYELIEAIDEIAKKYNTSPIQDTTDGSNIYNNVVDFISNALDSDKQFIEGKPLPTDNTKIETVQNIRTAKEINDLYRVCFGEAKAKMANIGAADEDEILGLFSKNITAIKDAIIWLAITATSAKTDLLNYISTAYKLTPASLDLTNTANINKIADIIHNKYDKNMTASEVKTAIDTFAKVCKLAKTDAGKPESK